ncbi:hypothetical protein C6Q04_13985, partial [Burkholderia multivorans]
AYFDLLVNSRFDAHPAVQQILKAASGKPGTFAKSMQSLPTTTLSDLNSNKFETVAVPTIPAGLLPSPRVEAHREMKDDR